MAGDSRSSKFNLVKLNDLLHKCRLDDGKISMELYLETFSELNKLFGLLGGIFGFVVRDVKEKIGILHRYRLQDDENGGYYQTVQSLIEYEVTNNITVSKTKMPSGSRTLLRLHRSLEFIIRFLNDVNKAHSSQNIGPVARNAYNDTLAKHHIWIVRKTVGIAVMTLSARDHLLLKMGEESVEQTVRLLEQTVVGAQPLYDTVQELYASSDILQLP